MRGARFCLINWAIVPPSAWDNYSSKRAFHNTGIATVTAARIHERRLPWVHLGQSLALASLPRNALPARVAQSHIHVRHALGLSFSIIYNRHATPPFSPAYPSGVYSNRNKERCQGKELAVAAP